MKTKLAIIAAMLLTTGCQTRKATQTSAVADWESAVSAAEVYHDTVTRHIVFEIDSIVISDTVRRIKAAGIRGHDSARASRELETNIQHTDSSHAEAAAKESPQNPPADRLLLRGALLALLLISLLRMLKKR